jgi:exosortase
MATTSTLPVAPPGRPAAAAAPPWRWWAVAAILALALLPLLVRFAAQLWLRPHYQFGPVVLLGSAVLAWLRVRRLGPLTPGSAGWAGLFLGVAAALLAAADLLDSSWLGAVAALALLPAALHAAGGGRLLRAALPAWVLLWLVVPPPFELDRQLILWLQSLVAGWASGVLDLLGVYHVMAGNVVETGGRRLMVEEACSGVNSLFSVLAYTLFFVFLFRRPRVHAGLLLAAAVAWVLVANVARVVGVAYFTTRWGFDLTQEARHQAFGALLFVLALGFLWSTDRLILFFAAPAVPPKPAAVAAEATRLPDRSVLTAWPVIAVFSLLALAPLALVAAGTAERPRPGAAAAPEDGVAADSLPARFGAWRRKDDKDKGFTTETRNAGSAFGEFSKVWTYQAGGDVAVFSLDYPFPSWHDLTRCYTGQGWTMEDQAVHQAEGGEATDGYVVVRLSKPAYRSGYLVFCQFDRDGAPLEPRRGAAYLSLFRHETVLRKWWGRLTGAPDPTPADPPGPVYQLQLFVESCSPLTPAAQKEAEAFFLQGRSALKRNWGRGPAAAPPAPAGADGASSTE